MTLTRLKAFALHLAISATVIAVYLGVVVVAWNPPPYFFLEATLDVIAIVVGVDVVLGPVLTLVVYKPGKPKLKMDITIIALLQVTFLAWGVYMTYTGRPYYNVFNVDRFTLLSERYVLKQDIRDPALARHDWQGPTLIYARPAQDARERNALIDRSLQTGVDLVQMADRYAAYAANLADVLAHSIDIRALLQDDAQHARALDGLLARRGGRESDYAYLPIEGRTRDGVAVVRRSDGEIVDILLVDPWGKDNATERGAGERTE